MFKNLYKYRWLTGEIVRKNIKLQYRNSVLGVFWTFLQPLLTTLVLVMVFSRLLGRDSKAVLNYPVFILCGRLLYEFYTQSTKRAMRSITLSASVIKKVYIPKYIYPLSNVISTFITFCISMLVLVAFIVYFQLFSDTPVNLTPYALLAWAPLLILFILCTGVGLILSVLEVFFRDIEYLYDVFCMLIFYLSPIIYQVNQLKTANQWVLRALMANPLYAIISMFRSCVLFGEMWNWNWFYYSLGFSVLMVLIGAALFYKKQDQFILHI
ncbi:MAG: ABC transporter permease [Oscillospiraceae bacterium]|nr:ABC transporter permease [Oscillospiraceae bacterium]